MQDSPKCAARKIRYIAEFFQDLRIQLIVPEETGCEDYLKAVAAELENLPGWPMQKNPHARTQFSDDQIRAIHVGKKEGETLEYLSRFYDVAASTISRITRKEIYRDVED